MGSVLVLGSCNTDLVLSTDRLPARGETVLGKDYFQAAGGKGANQAVAAARAGASVRFAGAVGRDAFGELAVAGLRREGIDVANLQQVEGVPSGVAMIMVDAEGSNLIGVAPGANSKVNSEFVRELPGELFERGGIFVAQLETPLEGVEQALHRAREAGMTTVLNPAPMDPTLVDHSTLLGVHVLIVNESEAMALAGEPPDRNFDWDDPSLLDGLLDRIHRLGPPAVLMTLGERGYRLSGREGRLSVPGYSVEAVDTVAAGDTFVGALAAGLAEGKELSDAAHWANAAAALSVTRAGAQPSIPDRNAIDTFFEL